MMMRKLLEHFHTLPQAVWCVGVFDLGRGGGKGGMEEGIGREGGCCVGLFDLGRGGGKGGREDGVLECLIWGGEGGREGGGNREGGRRE